MVEGLPEGERVFLDANVFVYHFSGVSAECRRLLEACEQGALRGVTSVIVLAEVRHRLMLLEAVGKRLVTAGNVVRKLRERPDVMRALTACHEQVERIPLMGVEVLPLDLRQLLGAADLQRRFGLLTNDALLAATALDAEIEHFASADADFERVEGLAVHAPGDLPG